MFKLDHTTRKTSPSKYNHLHLTAYSFQLKSNYSECGIPLVFAKTGVLGLSPAIDVDALCTWTANAWTAFQLGPTMSNHRND